MARETASQIIGREREIRTLRAALDSGRAELLAVYGRRRVGKTHLVRELYEREADVLFMVTGEKDAPLTVQLHHFRQSLRRAFGIDAPAVRSWREAFDLLADTVNGVGRSKRIALFFDELPWMATRRSGLVQALDYSWNTRISRMSNVTLVVCGSAAAWMLDKLVHAKGGLYNRVTGRIHLQPFDLKDAHTFLASRRVQLKPKQVLELYMAIGGVPHHLAMVERGRSAVQNVAAICFDRDGPLSDEYERLFASLYDDPETHDALVRAIAKRRSGVTLKELRAIPRFPSGGRLTARLRELEASGFIAELVPYGRRTRDRAYRIVDEFLWFHLAWLDRRPRRLPGNDSAAYWMSKSSTPAYRAWAGHAFEAICLKHSAEIQRALGIEGIATEAATWRSVPSAASSDGAQVDLLFDRADGVINLCEVKYSDRDFTITKACARELKRKIDVFERATKTKKEIFLTLVTTHGLKNNTWSKDLVDSVVVAEDLFR